MVPAGIDDRIDCDAGMFALCSGFGFVEDAVKGCVIDGFDMAAPEGCGVEFWVDETAGRREIEVLVKVRTLEGVMRAAVREALKRQRWQIMVVVKGYNGVGIVHF
jgi:hypothetical protein